MPELSFYILQSESLHDRYFFACRLIEKAYQNGQFCYVLMDTLAEAQTLDDMLWTFRVGSFIPHQILTKAPPDIVSQVLIGVENAPPAWRSIVFNLSKQLPINWESSTRILEILDNSESTKIAGRARYSAYKQAGATITTHKI
ncbi:MAG: DNA polymerase III subunit chi [Methylococcales bacterium]|jgi:DNA polymerase-3 subunit chi